MFVSFADYECLIGAVFGEVEGTKEQFTDDGEVVHLCRWARLFFEDIEALECIDEAEYLVRRVRDRAYVLFEDEELRAEFVSLDVSALRARGMGVATVWDRCTGPPAFGE